MKEGNNKRGQMNLSFGMIFSIILIVIFLAFGIYAILKFLELQESIQVSTFLNDFQNDINKMWKSSQGSQSVKYTLPTKINAVCFQQDQFENLKFTSARIIHGKIIDNIDIAKITKDENPFCVQNINGKVSMTIVKNFGEQLVTITR
ncbi:Uncharacterised protein [uncultured archaeon]|nr:Uncharacterised protein [uncultured archaeon]